MADGLTPAAAGKRRALFVNTGILGHKAVAALVAEAVAVDPGIEATHVDLSGALSVGERIVRKIVCARPFGRPRFGRASYDLGRWRDEIHAGLLARRRLREAARLGGFDALHFHTQAAAYCSLRRMTRVPSIVSVDITQQLASLEVESRLGRLTYVPSVWHDGLVFTRAAAITVISRWAADDLARHYPGAAAKIHLLPYPVRLDAADPAWIDQRYDATRGPAGRRPRVLFMGGDFDRKGGPELLDVWTRGDFGGRADLVLATGWTLPELPSGVRQESGIVPYTPAWRRLWRDADIFVMPSRGEAFGMVFQEAAAAGVPAVGTRLNAIPEIVDDGATGMLVAPRDGAALHDALTHLIDSAEERRRMGRAARARVEAASSIAAYGARLTALIREVADA